MTTHYDLAKKRARLRHCIEGWKCKHLGDEIGTILYSSEDLEVKREMYCMLWPDGHTCHLFPLEVEVLPDASPDPAVS